ncbi:sensor histidine kinase [Geodermatophilus sp. SYSU D01119]
MGRDRAGLRDWGAAVGVTAGVLVAALTRPLPEPAPLVLACLLAGGLSLAARRRAPGAVLAVTAALAVGQQVLGPEVPAAAFVVAVYAAVRSGRRVAAVAASVLVVVALPLALLAVAPDGSPGEALARARDVLQVAWLVAAGAAGEALRQAERRAEEAERTREETARRRADEERLRIARELHDSLTAQISVITVQAEVATHLAARRGEQVPEALVAIRDAAREATRELRATLEALRDDPADAGQGLWSLPALVERARLTGLDARLTVEGPGADVPLAVERAAYRIVQESLTNAARHAAAATASVRIEHRPGTLVVRVDDDGDALPGTAPVPGTGLLGMRERVAALGGRLQAAPRDGGGFTVLAELPVGQRP